MPERTGLKERRAPSASSGGQQQQQQHHQKDGGAGGKPLSPFKEKQPSSPDAYSSGGGNSKSKFSWVVFVLATVIFALFAGLAYVYVSPSSSSSSPPYPFAPEDGTTASKQAKAAMLAAAERVRIKKGQEQGTGGHNEGLPAAASGLDGGAGGGGRGGAGGGSRRGLFDRSSEAAKEGWVEEGRGSGSNGSAALNSDEEWAHFVSWLRLGHDSQREPQFPVTVVEESPERMVVIGDIHGDLAAFVLAMQHAGCVNEEGRWIGGETVLVQLGDIMDRGDHDLEVTLWIYALEREAAEAGGRIYSLIGNHELMNLQGDHSMASREAFMPFSALKRSVAEHLEENESALAKFPEWARYRLAAMVPGPNPGPVADVISSHSIALKIGDSLFVHGGILPRHINGDLCEGAKGMDCLANFNRYVHEWLHGDRSMPRAVLSGSESPVWTRVLSQPQSKDLGRAALAQLETVLRETGCARMFVGHTPQAVGINQAAGGKIWRVDSGMTSTIAGNPESVEVVLRKGESQPTFTVITAKGLRVPGDRRSVANIDPSAGRW